MAYKRKKVTPVYYTQVYDERCGWRNYNYHGMWIEDATAELITLQASRMVARIFTDYI